MGRVLALVAVAAAGLPGTRGGGWDCPETLPQTCSHCRAASGKCAHHSSSGTTGDVCEAVCDEGYYATNSWTLESGGYFFKDGYECKGKPSTRVQWTSPNDANLGCTAMCEARPVAHAAECPESSRRPVEHGGHACAPGCSAGFTQTGEGTFSCQANGAWKPEPEGAAVECKAVSCPAEPPCPNAQPCDATQYGGSCTAQCKPGYRPSDGSGGTTYRCAADGRWEGGDLGCEAVQDFCPAFGPQNQGVVVRPDEKLCTREVGALCAAVCDKGKDWERERGDELYRCEADENHGGVWKAERGEDLVCVQTCPVSKDGGPMVGSHFLPGCDFKPGGVPCEAQCDAGYKGGHATYTCVRTRTRTDAPRWVVSNNGEALNCTLTGCADSHELEHGEQCQSRRQDKQCRPSCLPGYYGNGTAEYTCQPNHQWLRTGDDVQCTAEPDWCNSTGPIAGSANVVIHGPCEGKINETCGVSCAAGTEKVQGNLQQYRCQTDGDWLPEQPEHKLVCERTCAGVKPLQPHASFPRDCSPSPSAECTAQCDKHYTQIGGNPVYRCSQTPDGSKGEWRDGSIVCEVLCDKGFAPTNETSRTETGPPCASCDAGRFSSDGKKCVECREPSANFTRCNRCPPGVGPNHDKTLCEPCAEGLDEHDGVCKPQKKSPNLEQDVEERWNDLPWTAKAAWILGVLAGVLVLACCYCAYSRHQPEEKQASVLRASFIGGSEKLPQRQLIDRDVPARWAKAEELYVPEEWEADSGSTRSPLQRSTSGSESRTARRKRKGGGGEVYVMFSNDHVRELEPPDWQQKAALGTGSYGVVFKATWRGREVAVKVLKLPQRPEEASSAADEALREQVEEITTDYVTEVEVCCDLNHPNLVRVLGYADNPKLMIMQELLRGNSMDHQLYVEKWKPTAEEVLKAAHDVARGMEYLHTMFLANDNMHGQPIIHRDLKTPNLMLATRPRDGEGVHVKVTDFGLSRDKALDANQNYTQTVMMTGCGSVLWMAPEILLGNTYNEKVDVFSYAMCLVELVDCKLPWSGVATGAEVPHRVTRRERPGKQLQGANPRLAQLIRDCWAPDPAARPDFTRVVLQLEEMMGIPSHRTASLGNGAVGSQKLAGDGGSGHAPGQSRRGTLEPLLESEEDSIGQTRTASPDLENGSPGSW